MKGINAFLWLGTPVLFLLVGALVWIAHQANDPVSPRPVIYTGSHRSSLSYRLPGDVYYRYGQPLPTGYKCSGADGVLYRTSDQGGSTVIVPLVVGGVHVRCSGDAQSSHRF
ncbi:cytochrome c-type biogenesis protein CcmH [Rhodanobacter sp. B04]|uniref:cytochrome c-type biogenesis protein CcmH n=1 Tax=Rhodanobacter sp. B04 TaxID=1945860 RepID=UPI001115512B|nr:cytochrome c-type biogenesis protein CcmH [Rhodanobacter sp. B04]